MTNRREFLRTTTAIAASSVLPNITFASSAPTYHFIETTTLNSWPIANRAQWCLDHKHDPILKRACDGLCNLSTNDSDRIIRLVVRRCGLNLIEAQSNQVTVHPWSQPATCLNCSGETILFNFGLKQVALFNPSPNFVSVRLKCQRSFVDDSISDVAGWMDVNLETDFCSVSELVWGKRVEF